MVNNLMNKTARKIISGVYAVFNNLWWEWFVSAKNELGTYNARARSCHSTSSHALFRYAARRNFRLTGLKPERKKSYYTDNTKVFFALKICDCAYKGKSDLIFSHKKSMAFSLPNFMKHPMVNSIMCRFILPNVNFKKYGNYGYKIIYDFQ
jgi:hypothetical protein